VVEIFTVLTLFYFHQKTLFLEKNRPQSQGQISKLKNLNRISKLHALERFFFRGGHPLNYLMHDPGLYGKGSRYYLDKNK
jgi:hypothetical protein